MSNRKQHYTFYKPMVPTKPRPTDYSCFVLVVLFAVALMLAAIVVLRLAG